MREMMKRDRASASLGMIVERDDIGHAVVMTRESARVLGEALIEHASAS